MGLCPRGCRFVVRPTPCLSPSFLAPSSPPPPLTWTRTPFLERRPDVLLTMIVLPSPAGEQSSNPAGSPASSGLLPVRQAPSARACFPTLSLFRFHTRLSHVGLLHLPLSWLVRVVFQEPREWLLQLQVPAHRLSSGRTLSAFRQRPTRSRLCPVSRRASFMAQRSQNASLLVGCFSGGTSAAQDEFDAGKEGVWACSSRRY